jgi:hypothetical protein
MSDEEPEPDITGEDDEEDFDDEDDEDVQGSDDDEDGTVFLDCCVSAWFCLIVLLC